MLDFLERVKNQVANQMVEQRVRRCVRACRGISDAALDQDPIAFASSTIEQLVNEKVDYMKINNLGNPETQHTVIQGRKALALLRRKV